MSGSIPVDILYFVKVAQRSKKQIKFGITHEQNQFPLIMVTI